MNDNLMKAILSMDSYNRGYLAGLGNNVTGLGGAGSKIGNLTILNVALPTGAQAAGFYAVAYDTNGDGKGDIISYRGTDDTLGSDSDITNGWVLGGGDENATQGNMAIQFYKDVVGSGNLRTANISLTGHSLGGGLAGYVASLYGKNALVYDSMGYITAANDARYYASLPVPVYTTTGQSFKDLIYNGADPWDLNSTGVQGFLISGEILDKRFNKQANPQIVDFGPDVNSQFGPLEKHSMSTLVLGMYGNDLSQKDWKYAAGSLWGTLYNDGYAKTIGMDSSELSGQMQTGKKYSDILRTILAYSAIDEGERPYGDTAIRALFNDANDFGKFLNIYAGMNLIGNQGFYSTKISEIFVQFSALLAIKDIQKAPSDKVTSADSQWSKLRVWVDANSDGRTGAGELKTLSTLKITQINLNATAEGTKNNGNPVTASSTFVMNGKTHMVSDVWFRHDQTDSRYMGEVTLDPKVSFLPTLKGFGNLKYLGEMMAA